MPLRSAHVSVNRMMGTILNAVGILVGGVIGLTVANRIKPSTLLVMKAMLGALTVFVGLKLTLTSLSGSFGSVMKQLGIVVLALTLGRMTGRLLHLQKFLNGLGRYAKERYTRTDINSPQRLSEGFITCTLLFCVGPMAIIGAAQDGKHDAPAKSGHERHGGEAIHQGFDSERLPVAFQSVLGRADDGHRSDTKKQRAGDEPFAQPLRAVDIGAGVSLLGISA